MVRRPKHSHSEIFWETPCILLCLSLYLLSFHAIPFHSWQCGTIKRAPGVPLPCRVSGPAWVSDGGSKAPAPGAGLDCLKVHSPRFSMAKMFFFHVFSNRRHDVMADQHPLAQSPFFRLHFWAFTRPAHQQAHRQLLQRGAVRPRRLSPMLGPAGHGGRDCASHGGARAPSQLAHRPLRHGRLVEPSRTREISSGDPS